MTLPRWTRRPAAALELHRASARLTPGVVAQYGIRGQERRQAAIHRHRERVHPHGRGPNRLVLFLRRQRHFVRARRRACPRDLQRQRRRGLDPGRRQVVGSREAPAAVRQHADSDALRFGAGDVPRLAVLGGDLPLARLHRADIGVGDAAPRHGIQRAQGQVFHRGVISPPSLSASPEAVRGKRVE